MFRLICLLSVLLLRHNLVGGDCPSPNFFDCGNDLCVALFWVCDGEDDCGNFRDEIGCDDRDVHSHFHNVSCPSKYVHCNGSRDHCIPEKWVCDGMKDCDSGSDESNCLPSKAHCVGFQCANFQCIPSRWRCDGVPDCLDDSDEKNCSSTKVKNCDNKHGYYQCFSGQCIPHAKVCDKRKDCPEGDDEGVECNTGGCHRQNCSHHCFPSPRGPQCYCPDGYELGSDSVTCLDVDECVDKKNDGICSQKCINTEGSYRCDCFDGYRLVNNNSCVAKEGEPIVLFANGEGIRGLWLARNLFAPVYPSLKFTVGLDVYVAKEKVFWVDVDSFNSGVYSVDLTGDNFTPIITAGLKGPEDIAIDWIGQNIYITDAALNKIIVCQLNGSICSSNLFGHLHLPRAIVVDPPNGYVYWTEWGSQPGIYQAGMDGSNRVTLVGELIEWPNGLAHDSVTNRLYWTEAKRGAIEYYDLTSKQRNSVLRNNVFHPFSISVFEDNLYWSDWDTFSLDTCNKFTGHNQTTLLKEVGQNIMSVHVYHPLKQTKSYDPCWTHPCSHMCLITPNRTYACACPDHMLLDRDRHTCVARPADPFLLVSADSRVKKYYSESIGKDLSIDVHIPPHVKTGDMTYNWNTQTLYVFDQNKLSIGAIDLKRSLHYFEPIIESQLDKVEGLSYDSHTNYLYWVEVKAGLVEVSNLNGSQRAVLVKNLDKPIDIALYAEIGRMFIAVLGSKPHIIVCDMDGGNRKQLLSSPVGSPISLALDKTRDKLFWANAKDGTIEWSNVKAAKGHEPNHGVAKRHLGYVMSIAISNNSVYWTDMETDYLYHDVYLHKSTQLFKIALNSRNQKPSEKKIFLAMKEEVLSAPCLESNGGCSQLCLLTRFGHVCHCSSGYHLADDHRTCVKDSDLKSIEIIACSDGNCNDSADKKIVLNEFIPNYGDEDDDLSLFETDNRDSDSVDIESQSEKPQYFNSHSRANISINLTDNKSIHSSKIKPKLTMEKHYGSDKRVEYDGSASKVETGNGHIWVNYLIGLAVTALIILLVIGFIKRDYYYRKVESVLYKKDGFRGIVIQNPIYRADVKGTDEEPLNDDNDNIYLPSDDLI